jgi:predicted nucleotidyltransferase
MLKDIQSLQKQVQPILKEAGVASSFVFGSYARGEATQTSDVDLLVEFMPNDKSLFDLIRLKHRLEDTLGVSVDINTSAAVHPSLRTFIDRDKVRIL